MAKNVVCPACGAKMKASRAACLRCGEKLVTGEPEVERVPSRLSKLIVRRGPILAVSVALPLLTVWIAIASQAAMAGPASVPQGVHVTHVPARAPSSEPESSGVGAPTAASEPTFLDAGRGGTAAYTRGDFTSAITGYQAAIRRNPNDLDALNDLGQALVRAGRAAESIQYFERAIALNRTNWGPRFNLGHAYGVLNDWPDAVSAYRAAAEVFPDDYVTCYNLGLALHKMGQEEAAIAEFQKAIALAPGEPSFHMALAISYERLQKTTEAIQAYEDYLHMAPAASDEAQVKARIDMLKKPRDPNQA